MPRRTRISLEHWECDARQRGATLSQIQPETVLGRIHEAHTMTGVRFHISARTFNGQFFTTHPTSDARPWVHSPGPAKEAPAGLHVD